MILFPETERRIRLLGDKIQEVCTGFKTSEVLGVCLTLAIRTARRMGVSWDSFSHTIRLMWDKEESGEKPETTSPG
jgi:hypothetical protein